MYAHGGGWGVGGGGGGWGWWMGGWEDGRMGGCSICLTRTGRGQGAHGAAAAWVTHLADIQKIFNLFFRNSANS